MLVLGVFLVGLLGLVAIVIVPARTERADVSGTKVYAKFLLVVVYLFIFVGIFSAFGVVRSVTGLMESESSGRCEPGPMHGLSLFHGSQPGEMCLPLATASPDQSVSKGDRAARGGVLFGLVFLVSLSVIWTIGHAAQRLFASEENRRGPPGRVLDAYLFSTAFVALVVLVVSVVSAIYSLFAVVGPGTFGAPRGSAAANLISTGVLAVLADAVLFWHVRHAWRLHASDRPSGPRGADDAAQAAST